MLWYRQSCRELLLHIDVLVSYSFIRHPRIRQWSDRQPGIKKPKSTAAFPSKAYHSVFSAHTRAIHSSKWQCQHQLFTNYYLFITINRVPFDACRDSTCKEWCISQGEVLLDSIQDEYPLSSCLFLVVVSGIYMNNRTDRRKYPS